MPLIELESSASRHEATITFYPSGKIALSDTFVRLTEIRLPIKISFHREKTDIRELFISFSTQKGVPLAKRKQGTSGCLQCSSRSTINQLHTLFTMLTGAKEFKTISFRLAVEPTDVDGLEVYAVITRDIVSRK